MIHIADLRDSKFKVDEDKLAQLLGMGFNQKDAEEALRVITLFL